MSHADLIKRIRAFLASASENECFKSQEIANALGEAELEVRAALANMVGKELVTSHQLPSGDVKVYRRAGGFVWRKITPLFAGTPEHIVETYEGRLICWCPSEFDARIIADALKRS